MSSAVPPSTPAALASADPALKAAVLGEALPYLRRYSGETILKYGGHAMGDTGGSGDTFARDTKKLTRNGDLGFVGKPEGILLELFTEGGAGTLNPGG
jgi:hypothetical protein